MRYQLHGDQGFSEEMVLLTAEDNVQHMANGAVEFTGGRIRGQEVSDIGEWLVRCDRMGQHQMNKGYAGNESLHSLVHIVNCFGTIAHDKSSFVAFFFN